MIIYPAIDIRYGKCVRLYQGDYTRETVYNVDPIAMAKKFVDDGAEWLHVVDLDGAKDPQQNQSLLIAELIKISGIKVQTGGGIRSKEQVNNLLVQGAARVVIGSLAVKNPKEVAQWFNFFAAEQIVLALDVIYNKSNQPMVVIDAWQSVSQSPLWEVIEYYQAIGLKNILCTNVTQDGTLSGPDYALYATLQARYPALNIQASGGIQSLADIQLLRGKQLGGAIIGRALYENKFTLPQALAC